MRTLVSSWKTQDMQGWGEQAGRQAAPTRVTQAWAGAVRPSAEALSGVPAARLLGSVSRCCAAYESLQKSQRRLGSHCVQSRAAGWPTYQRWGQGAEGPRGKTDSRTV